MTRCYWHVWIVSVKETKIKWLENWNFAWKSSHFHRPEIFVLPVCFIAIFTDKSNVTLMIFVFLWPLQYLFSCPSHTLGHSLSCLEATTKKCSYYLDSFTCKKCETSCHRFGFSPLELTGWLVWVLGEVLGTCAVPGLQLSVDLGFSVFGGLTPRRSISVQDDQWAALAWIWDADGGGVGEALTGALR